MTQNAGPIDEAAANTEGTDAAESFQNAQGDIGDYLSNVNSALAAGNPFQSKDYLTQQNLATSGAMNSESDAAKNAIQQDAARTGTNTAAIANTEAEAGRQGQRDLTQYNAQRDTQNENTWLSQQDKLLGDQATGANEEAELYGTGAGTQAKDLSSETSAGAAVDQMWGNIAKGVGSAAGGLLGGVFSGPTGGGSDDGGDDDEEDDGAGGEDNGGF